MDEGKCVKITRDIICHSTKYIFLHVYVYILYISIEIFHIFKTLYCSHYFSYKCKYSLLNHCSDLADMELRNYCIFWKFYFVLYFLIQ